MQKYFDNRKEDLEHRLSDIHRRLQWIADTEARAAWVRGYGADGEFMDERERLIARAEKVIDEMEHLAKPTLAANALVGDPSGPRTGRKSLIENRVQSLIANFEHYVNWYDVHVPFDRPDQLNSHLATIQRRLELKTAAAAAADRDFRESLYRTLQSWGIGQRGSRLLSRAEFDSAIVSAAPRIAKLDGATINDPSLDVDAIAAQLWAVLGTMNIVDNKAPLVPCTKALHHLLPDLVVPMDREYTRTFFGWHAPEFQGHGRPDGQRSVFTKMFCELVRIARATNPESYVCAERPWRTSRTKVLDNALVGFCMAEGLQRPS